MIIETYRKFVAYAGMILLGTITASFQKITLGKAVNINRTLLAPFICRGILFCIGVKVQNQINKNLYSGNVVYFFNHNSFLDIFIIPMLGLKDTRFIITEGVKKIIPLHLCNIGIDVLYIPDSPETTRRIEFFKRVTDDLKTGKYSVICAPEGRHDFLHGIAPFNRGVVHMATASQCPIHTLFFDIPRESNPVHEQVMKACSLSVKSMELIETKNWSEADVSQNKEWLRSRFLHYYKEHYGDYGDSLL